MSADIMKAMSLVELDVENTKELHRSLKIERAAVQQLTEQLALEKQSRANESQQSKEQIAALQSEIRSLTSIKANLEKQLGGTQTSYSSLANSLARVENSIISLSREEKKEPEIFSAISRALESIKNQITALNTKEKIESKPDSSEWNFTPVRDGNGHIVNVTARRK